MPRDTGNALVWNQNMAEFSAESVLSFDNVAVENDASAVPRPDYNRNRSFTAGGAENRVVPPQRGRVGIIQIGNGLAELVRQAFADIESCPLGMHKIGGTTGAKLARGAGRPGRVQSDGNNVINRNSCQIGCDLQTVGDLLETDLRSLFRESRMLAQLLNEETFPRSTNV